VPGTLSSRLVLYSSICNVEVVRRWWGYEISGWRNALYETYTQFPASLVWPAHEIPRRKRHTPHARSSDRRNADGG
jgi:hypothetical protein